LPLFFPHSEAPSISLRATRFPHHRRECLEVIQFMTYAPATCVVATGSKNTPVPTRWMFLMRSPYPKVSERRRSLLETLTVPLKIRVSIIHCSPGGRLVSFASQLLRIRLLRRNRGLKKLTP
jgi:hypothetical protein